MGYMPVLGPDIGSKLAVLVLFGSKTLTFGQIGHFSLLLAGDMARYPFWIAVDMAR
jgi:hypothetical protein